MNKHALYEHELVEGFDKFTNLEVYADMETTLQTTQTQQTPQKMIFKVPKVSVYNKRINSEALGTSE